MTFVLVVDEHLTFHKYNQNDDSSCSRGNESDVDDDAQRNDADITSNVDILQRHGKDYDCRSATTGRQFINTPQYHLMPTEEEESERRQSAKGQQLERMQRRRKARLNRQSAGVLVSTADNVPGFRGEESLDELISYIDAPALTASDCKTAARKSKKKKKKVSMAGNSDAGEQKLANSCEVFVGTSGVSPDEPSVRVGDSCYIELRKKSDYSCLPDNTSTPVDSSVYQPDSSTCVDLCEQDKNDLATSTIYYDDVDPDVVVSQDDVTCTDTSHLNDKLREDLPEVVYAEVKNSLLEEENVSGDSVEFVTTAELGEGTLAVGLETAADFLEDNCNGNQTSTDVDLLSVESGNTANRTGSVCSLSAENVGAALPPVSDNILPLLTGSDSVTSDAGSVEDLFITVQKKKRTKITSVTAEDPRQRYGRRSSAKGAEDKDSSCCIKRSIVPSVSVSRSSIVYPKPSYPVTQRSAVTVAQYSQVSNPDTVLSSSVTDKCKSESLSAASVMAESEAVTEQYSTGEPTVKDYDCSSSHTDEMHRSDGNEQKEFDSDSVTPVNSPEPAIIVTRWQASGLKTLVCDECDNKTDSYTSSDIPVGTGDATSCDNDIKQKPLIDVMAGNKLNESAVKTEFRVGSVDHNLDVHSETGENQLADDGKVKSSQLSVQNASASDVFLDTRNIAGTTPPRSDISFGFDLNSSPELSDVSVSQCDSALGETFSEPVASCHCPVVAPMPPPAAGCAPILYFYPAMPVTILPPVATFPTGRCTPVGVVPPMPAVADVSNISFASPTWQSDEDKVISVPVPLDGQNIAVNDDAADSDATVPPTSNKATNMFVLAAAQRYLYSGMLSLWLFINVN